MIKKVTLLFFVFFAAGLTVHADDNIVQQFQGFDLAGYNTEGNKTWDIEGDTADIIGDVIKLTNIVANAYGAEKMHLTADDGTLDKISGNIHLENDVVITAEDGSQLLTDSLDWDRNEDLVQTEDEVTLTKESMVAVGKGMRARPDLKTALINEDVSVQVETESGNEGSRTITITCDGPLEIDYQKQLAIFNDNVVAVDVGRQLVADKIELYFDMKTSEIKEMICIGNVSVTQGGSVSYSDRMVYKAKDQSVIFLGRPKLIFNYGDGEK